MIGHKTELAWHSCHNQPSLSWSKHSNVQCFCLVHITIFMSAIKTQIFPPPVYSCSRYWAGVATDNGWVHDNLYTMAQSIVLVITAPSLETSCQLYPKVVWLSDVLHLVVHHGILIEPILSPSSQGCGVKWHEPTLTVTLTLCTRSDEVIILGGARANIDTGKMLLHTEIQNRTYEDLGAVN